MRREGACVIAVSVCHVYMRRLINMLTEFVKMSFIISELLHVYVRAVSLGKVEGHFALLKTVNFELNTLQCMN